MTIGHLYSRIAGLALLMVGLALGWPHEVRADGFRYPAARLPDSYKQECAACHLAYPPTMLPAASWQRLMTGLDRHFGSDASLDEKSVREIARWLEAQAGTERERSARTPPQDRITRTDWFERKHRHIDETVWRLPSVKSAARCEACHTRADQGTFDDDHLRMPAGLNARQRRAWDSD